MAVATLTYNLQWRILGSGAPWKSIARVLTQAQIGALQPLVIYNLRFVPASTGGVLPQWRLPSTAGWVQIGPNVALPVNVTANQVYAGRISPTQTTFVALMQGAGRLGATTRVGARSSARLGGGGTLMASTTGPAPPLQPSPVIRHTASTKNTITVGWDN
jgi:hypothetical protein